MASYLPIVGIGASAGGVEALEALFRAMPYQNGMAFVVVTHLDPNRESMLAEILGRATRMPVANARDGEPVEAQHVYVLPAGAILTIREGQLHLRRTDTVDRERTPIDLFFNSLAKDQTEHAIGIVLSGGGTDGTLGLKAIKESGGLTVAQGNTQGSNMSRPRFSEMPASAVAAGFVDLLLPVEEIPERLLAYIRDWRAFDPERPADALSKIYALLRTRTGHDFSQYKDKTFQRRIQRRMQVVQTVKLDEYVERLQKEPDEVSALFRDMLIGVTNFFRDLAPFRALETLVIPKLVEGKGADDEVRVWVPGCATGEEAYSIAILLREQMDGLQGTPKVQIFATDIDEGAMAHARTARYPANLVKDISLERLKRFFVSDGGSYHLVREVRDMCIFSAHSVIRDPPFSRLDLISCRNVLIYLKLELQKRVIPLFHYALRGAAICSSAPRRTSLRSPIYSHRSTGRTASFDAVIWAAGPASRLDEESCPTTRGRTRRCDEPALATGIVPIAKGRRHDPGAFCSGPRDRRRRRPGAVLFGGHRKISSKPPPDRRPATLWQWPARACARICAPHCTEPSNRVNERRATASRCRSTAEFR